MDGDLVDMFQYFETNVNFIFLVEGTILKTYRILNTYLK